MILHLLHRFNPQSFTRVHTQGSGTTTITIAFWAIFLAVARFAVDLIHMYSYRGAVQILSAHHWVETK